MTRLRRHRAGLLALLLVALGVVLVLLAFDARSWHRTVARDDVRFRSMPGHVGLWKPATTLPGDPAGALLGTGDALAYRRGLQLFWYSRIGLDPQSRQDLPTLRAEAQQQLLGESAHAANAHERSAAANLLGVLVVTSPAPSSDQSTIEQILGRAAGYFKQAVEINPGNVDAKLNLELVLRVQRPDKGKLGQEARSGYGMGRGHAASTTGTGY